MNMEKNIVQTKLLTFSKGKISKPRNYIKLLSMKDIYNLYPNLKIDNIKIDKNSKFNINKQKGSSYGYKK